ncbi:uncharacterized protein LOC131550960 [Onychostoma macrolepis]|uniref:uncharacterized protein LOC131550960 n=1 Tax=Onychostoma macrolepis TaxID=369639 RepID=UPI00272A2214|nr:uncharacterized protein LOC131550960 [Onychostoma macrolepis]
MATFREHLQQLHLYFHNSANKTAVLKAAAESLGLKDLKMKQVKDTCWLSQHLTVITLQKNLGAVLAALANETEVNKCPVAKGLYGFCFTYRFVAALYLQADVLPHLACLNKIFQKENVNFWAIKEQACLKAIRDAQPPGSFLAQLHDDLDAPASLGALSIIHEEERDRRGRDQLEQPSEVMEPYQDGLLDSLDRRFQNIDLLGSFQVLGPQAPKVDDAVNLRHLKTLSTKFLQQPEHIAMQEWLTYKEHFLTGAFKNMDQLTISSQYDEWRQLYPSLSQLAAIALKVPISSVNCKRDFSVMNRVKTELRYRLQGDHLAACMRISINRPSLSEFPYQKALELFFKKPRKI